MPANGAVMSPAITSQNNAPGSPNSHHKSGSFDHIASPASRDTVSHRARGFSSSGPGPGVAPAVPGKPRPSLRNANANGVDLPSSSSPLPPSTTVGERTISRKPSLEQQSFLHRPSLSRSHSKQTSHARETSLARSNSGLALMSHAHSHSPSSSIPEVISEREVAAHGTPRPGGGRVSEDKLLPPRPLPDGLPLPPPEKPLTATFASPVHSISSGSRPRLAPEHTLSDAARSDSATAPPIEPLGPLLREMDTFGEFAMEHVFSTFKTQADQKLNHCMLSFTHQDAQVEAVCGPGVDPRFDQLIITMADMVKAKPKPLIDKIMNWRMAYGEPPPKQAADVASPKPSTASSILGEISPPASVNSSFTSTNSTKIQNRPPGLIDGMRSSENRKSIATYILCRVLVEIFRHTTLEALTPEFTAKFADIVYQQLRDLYAMGSNSVESSPLQSAKWHAVIQLLDIISGFDFDLVAKKFLEDLLRCHRELSVKGQPTHAMEVEASFVMRSMQHLKLPGSSETAWSQTTKFMQYIADMFTSVHGQNSKIAYCRLVEKLLLTVPLSASSIELNKPTWRVVTHLLNDRISQLVGKPKYWQYAFPLQAILLCVSPYDIFTRKWQATVSSVASKLNQKNNRATALKAICRLLWMYTQRTQDSPSAQARTIDDITKSVLFSGKRYSITMEPVIAEPLIQLIRIIAHWNCDKCFRSIIFPFLSAELLVATKDVRELKLEQLDPDRCIVAIRAFLIIMNDLEKNANPPFPTNFVDERDELNSTFNYSSFPRSPLGHKTRSEKASVAKVDRLSQIVVTTDFTEIMRDYYFTICDVLGKIILLSDPAYGGQAAWTERHTSPAPKTPISEPLTMLRRDDSQLSQDDRDSYYELFFVAVQTVPRCVTSSIPLNQILSVICAATAHMEQDIAKSAAHSLRAIARQGHAQAVVERLSSFLLGYDARYSSTFEGAILDPSYIESILRIYIDLLHLWTIELAAKTSKSASDGGGVTIRAGQLDMTNAIAQVDRVESSGLFFLCSPSSRVRKLAVDVLSHVPRLDSALASKPINRIYELLRGGPWMIMSAQDETLTVGERMRLEQGKRKGTSHNSIADLCSSDHEASLWRKVFPFFIQASCKICEVAVAEARQDVCKRLSQMHSMVETLDERMRMPPPPMGIETNVNRAIRRQPTDNSNMMIEQWKLYLMFACTTLTRTDSHSGSAAQESQHTRKASKSSQTTQDSFNSAGDLFNKVIPLLGSSNQRIRDAAVEGLGAINVNLYRSLLEALDVLGPPIHDDPKRNAGQHQRAISSPRRPHSLEIFLTEVARVYRMTARFLLNPDIYSDTWILDHLASYTKGLSKVFSSADPEYNVYDKLRLQYCGLVEAFFNGLNKTEDLQRWMTFSSRRAAFTLMEEWCGHQPTQPQPGKSPRSAVHEIRSSQDRPMIQSTEEGRVRKDLKSAALSAMATLCAGPMIVTTGNSTLQFDFKRITSWINTMFRSQDDKTHVAGKKALKNVILQNPDVRYFTDRSIEMLYLSTHTKAVESYIDVIYEVFMQPNPPDVPFWKLLGILLFTLGNDNKIVRRKAARLLKKLEERQNNGSKSHNSPFDYGTMGDTTTAVTKKIQFETSERLAEKYPEHAFCLFSELSKYFNHLDFPISQKRNMVVIILPWIKTVGLQLDASGAPTAGSFMMLINLLEMTARSNSAVNFEIQALWQALATGPHAGNVKMILDFVHDFATERKELILVTIARQVVVFLSTTESGKHIFEILLQNIGPRSMTGPVTGDRQSVVAPSDTEQFPYVASFNSLGSDTKLAGVSDGQLAMILLVDLITSSVMIPADQVPGLLQIVLVLWDHHLEIVREQAHEMLVHLLYSLIVPKLDEEQSTLCVEIEEFIEAIRNKNMKFMWSYDDNDGTDSQYDVSPALKTVVDHTIKFFSAAYPAIAVIWGRTSIEWATGCPVRHLACRSFQVFRSILEPVDMKGVLDFVARLSVTVGDDEDEIQIYAREIIRSCRAVMEKTSEQDVQLIGATFWTMCICLSSHLEIEFTEGLDMLDVLLEKFDLSDAGFLAILQKPMQLSWPQGGLTSLLYMGCRSEKLMDRCLKALDHLIKIPSHPLVGDDERLLYITLANLPRFMHAVKTGSKPPQMLAAAATLAWNAEVQGYTDLSSVLSKMSSYTTEQYHTFLSEMLAVIQPNFFPQMACSTLTFIVGLLSNNSPTMRIELLSLLNALLPLIDLNSLDYSTLTADLVSPLLRMLQTDLRLQTLPVLEQFMAVPGSNIGKSNLHMSMLSSRSSRALRRPFANVQSQYGIPEPSGWSHPMPFINRQVLRTGMQSIYILYADGQSIEASPGMTPDVEFYREERPNTSYFFNRSGTVTSDDATLADTSFGELVKKLDTLDDFFDSDTTQIETERGVYGQGTDYGSQNTTFGHANYNPSSTSLQGSYQFPPRKDMSGMSSDASTVRSGYNYSTSSSIFDPTAGSHSHQSSHYNHTSNYLHGDHAMQQPTHHPQHFLHHASNSQSTTLSRNTSVSSLNEVVRMQPIREPAIMSPSAFSTSSRSSRPGLNRAVTSPATNYLSPSDKTSHFPISPPGQTLYESETFSDDDTPLSRVSTSDVPLSSQADNWGAAAQRALPVRKSSFKNGVRNGLKRLTGERRRSMTRNNLHEDSPEVPPVPDFYLRNPKSAEP